jgi:hypothetical protein
MNTFDDFVREPAMAMLTTIGGRQITFSPGGVQAIADHDATTGAAVTCIFGLNKEMLRIEESVPMFMARVKITKNLAQLTRPNGSPVWISGAAVSSLRAPLPGEYVAGVNTVVSTDALVQGVKEISDEVTLALNDHGGDL